MCGACKGASAPPRGGHETARMKAGARSAWQWFFRLWTGAPFGRPLLAQLSAPAAPVLRPLFADSAIAMAVLDRRGRVLSANTALTQLLAATAFADSVPEQALALFVPSDRDRLWQDWAALLAGEARRSARAAGLAGAEVPRQIEVAGVPVRERDGTISGLVLSLTDISARQRLEEELVQARKLQAVGQLAGGIAHDFNNLLTAIGGAVEGLRERAGSGGTPCADLAIIEESARRGAGLVRQLLAFARQQTLQPEIVAVNDAVRGIAELLGRLLGQRIALTLDLEEPGRHVRVDRSQLDQVLMNLAFNARDAMPEGGRLTLATGHLTLLRPRAQGAETMPPGRYVTITVTDSGTGIPPEVITRIFEPFFTTKRASGGSGLGLATVLGIMRQSGGFVAVESAPGQGTRIELFLPRVTPPAAQTSHPPARAAASASSAAPEVIPEGGKMVLLVEDEEPLRRLAERALRRVGLSVRAAENGEAALALIENGVAPDLVVSDVMMPGMDGPALVRALRVRSPRLPAILVSGFAASELRGGLADGNLMFLAKPYTLKALQQAARECLADAPTAR